MATDPDSHLWLGELETRKLVGIVDVLRLFEPRIKLLEGGTIIFLHINDRADELDAIKRAPGERKRRIAEHIEMCMRIGDRRIELRRRDKTALFLLALLIEEHIARKRSKVRKRHALSKGIGEQVGLIIRGRSRSHLHPIVDRAAYRSLPKDQA